MSRRSLGGFGALRGEHDQVTERRRIREEHEEPVNPESQYSRRRHAVLERAEEVLVERMCLLDARGFELLLELELRPLFQRVGELGERGDQLEATDDEIEVLRQLGVRSVRPG